MAVAIGVGAEWIARWAIARGAYFVLLPGQRERLRPHRPTHPQLEEVVTRDINKLGERGGRVPRRGRIYRVLVVGGSAAECYLLDQETQWPGVLQNHLRRPELLGRLGADDAHVGNVGRSGVDSGSLKVMLPLVLHNYSHLDVIVVMVGASDVLRWLEIGAPADRSASPLRIPELFASHPTQVVGWRVREWGLSEMFRRLRARRGIVRPEAGRWIARARQQRSQAVRILDVVPPDAVLLSSFGNNLRSIIESAAAKADRVLVVRQPWFAKNEYSAAEEALMWNGGLGKIFEATVTEFYSSKVICTLMSRVDAKASQVALASGVEDFGLQGLIPSDATNFIDHFHFTPAASRNIGRLVAERLAWGQPTGGSDP